MFGAEGHALELPSTGLLISKKLADLLGAQVGDRLLVEFLEGVRPRHDLFLQGLIQDSRQIPVMNINAVRQLMPGGSEINGAHLKIDPLGWPDFLESVKAARGSPLRDQVGHEGKFPTVDGESRS
jgi:putative ABC transport system permease protein